MQPFVTQCSIIFTNQTTYSIGTSSQSLNVVDVNGDGKPDIIVVNYGSDNVGVLLNIGNGTFAAQATYSTGYWPSIVVAVDVNGDGKPDIIVANSGSNNTGVLLNTGNGTFAAQTTYSIGYCPISVVAADVNDDGKPDIIVANYASDNVGVLLNTGNGTFAAQKTYSNGSGSYPSYVAAADVNGDGKSDIIVANYGSGNVGVLLNIGNGTFTAQATYSTGSGSYPSYVAAADVNGDNKLDIIVVNSGYSNVDVFLAHC
ncbi:unnamed protein product [Rotaria magnacalcarata]|uniref:VCBS repeat-containing protein n=1 Tax=Rotaria magnacalcarata TaxID=392030 RepID=A0A820F8F1_9BILA|nr:unnamed protein product [Rotaria magnacalcarata]